MRFRALLLCGLIAGCPADDSPSNPGRPDAQGQATDGGHIDGGHVDAGGTPDAGVAPKPLRLTILHNNDGESQLLNAGSGLEDFGGIARFVAKHRQLRTAATAPSNDGLARGALSVSSGDNVLPGAEFQASFARGVPYFDSLALQHIGYDAIALGNHDFDLGPEVLADLIVGVMGESKFVSANLDFSMEPRLAALVGTRLVTRATIEVSPGIRVGIIGLTTPTITSISSPRRVAVDADVNAAVAREVTALEAEGIQHIVLISHLQELAREVALVTASRGIDVVVAGGGDELLANASNTLVPGDGPPVGPYPLVAPDAEGRNVPIVTTPGSYKYIGKLVVDFDLAGNVTGTQMDSGLLRVAGGAETDAVAPDPAVQAAIETPLSQALQGLATNTIATSAVPLDGQRASVRSRETNLGDLIADAFMFEATRLAPGFGFATPTVALMNGGGIRNDSIIPAGPITELATFDVLPFSNSLVVVPDVSPAALLGILEYAAREVGGGSFLHVAGMTVEVDYNAMSRVRTVTLTDGTVLVSNAQAAAGAPNVTIATISFLAGGGGGAPFSGLTANSLGATDQQALARFVADPAGLNGQITAAAYPVGGNGRLVVR